MKLRTAALLALCSLPACESTPRPRSASSTDMVPSNSAFEGKGASGSAEAPKPAPAPVEEPSGSGGVVSPPAGGAAEPTAAPSAASTSVRAVMLRGPEPAGPPATGVVSQAECGALFDRYIDLEIGANTKLSGIPPEMIKQLVGQAKAQARAQSGDPCAKDKVTRAKYNCAMAAATTAAWQACMK